MLDAAHETNSFSRGRKRADLGRDRMLTLALIKSLETIGEAANGVSSDTQNRYPGIPWRDIIGMRNRLVHVYFDVDLDLVWDTIRTDLPPLIAELERVLDAERVEP